MNTVLGVIQLVDCIYCEQVNYVTILIVLKIKVYAVTNIAVAVRDIEPLL
jgi:hypothetical protein